jgi:pimeloyl-ACP methyl ester carboxylesterase
MTTFGAKIDRRLWSIPSKIPEHGQTRSLAAGESILRIRDSGGAGKALIFLCDPPMTVEAYDDLIDSFQPEFRVIVIELPGFGFSSTSSADQLTFKGAVESVEAGIAQLDLDQVVLFGPCVCGFVATEVAKRGRVSLTGVVLMQTPNKVEMLSWVERMDPKGFLRVPVLGQMMVKLSAKKVVNFWLKYATAQDFEQQPFIDATTEALERGCGFPLATMLQLWSDGTRDAHLEIPGLIVWGGQDRSHRYTDAECTQAHLKNAEIIRFADCGHFTELEQPSAFATSVKPFLYRSFYENDA